MNTQEKLFIEAVRKGADVGAASSLAGNEKEKILNDLLKGKQEAKRLEGSTAKTKPQDEHALNLWRLYNRALADFTMASLESIRLSEDWKAHKWLLEKNNPRYGSQFGTVNEGYEDEQF